MNIDKRSFKIEIYEFDSFLDIVEGFFSFLNLGENLSHSLLGIVVSQNYLFDVKYHGLFAAKIVRVVNRKSRNGTSLRLFFKLRDGSIRSIKW